MQRTHGDSSFSRASAGDGDQLPAIYKSSTAKSDLCQAERRNGVRSGSNCVPGNGCAAGTEIAETDFTYDQGSLTGISNLTNHDETNFKSSIVTGRGNVTTITKKCVGSATCTPSTTTFTYDETGQIATMTDGCGNATCSDMTGTAHTTTYSFSDSYSSGTPSGNTNTYLTSIHHPATSAAHNESFEYDWMSGNVTSSLDENSRTTAYTYDSYFRPHIVNYPDGGQTTINYIDGSDLPSETPSSVTTLKLMSSGISEASTVVFDGLGHTSQTILDDPEGNVTSESAYDGEGHIYSKTNPHRAATSTTDGTSYSYYDALGRPTLQIHPDNNFLQWCYDGVSSVLQPGYSTSNCNSHIGGRANVSWVDSQDESGNQWQRTSDGLGNLIQAEEPSGVTKTPSLETDYAYDGLSNMLSVNQKGNGTTDTPRVRSFTYNSLSQLITSNNPETGTITYGPYDADGNLTKKTDARSIYVNYLYDNLGRLYSKTYSSGDPSACMQYDTAISGSGDPNPIGHLTLEWTQSSASACPSPLSPLSAIPTAYNSTAVMDHDAMGRVQVEQQCPNPQGCGTTKYAFNYAYDLAGNPTSFNNGMPIATSTSTEPALNWGVGYQYSGSISAAQIATASVSPFLTTTPYSNPTTPGQPSAWSASSFPTPLLNLPVATTQTTWAYDPMGHMVNEQASIVSSAAGLKVVSSYDNRGRILQEQAFGHDAPASIATGSFGVVEVNGAEQTASPIFATGTVNISGTEQSTTFDPCSGSGHSCPQTVYDNGPVTLTINGTQIETGYSQGSTPATIATALVSLVNSASVGVTATATGGTVNLTASVGGTSGNVISISATTATADQGTGQGQFPGPSFTATTSGATLTGGANTGGTPVYDSGTVQVVITNGSTNVTSAAVPWGQNSTGKTLATAIASAINTAQNSNGNFVSATVDSNGYSVDLKSTGTGSSDNYPVSVVVSQTSSPLFVNPSFSFDASSTSGGQAAYSNDNYAPIYTYGVPTGGYAANSNLMSYSDSVMGVWGFQYDTLNRLTGMAPAGNAPAAYVNLIGCYGYDDTGNRSLAGLTSSDCSGSNPPTATYNSSNRVTSGGYIYDSDGNVYYDGTNYYAYDAEDRLCAVETFLNGGPSTWWQYIYDAEGLRVAKATFTGSFPAKNTTCAAPGTETTFTLKNQYLLDQGGNQVTEMDGSGTWMHSNVWAGAHLEATYDLDPSTNAPALHFHLGDPLGTRRVQTNVLGQVEETCQSLPFGDGLNCVQPAGAPATADDATTHHFTSKERDTESGNDYFGARYYASSMGRFTSPDPSGLVYADPTNPQSLNLYNYVLNNPLVNVDPNGLDCLYAQDSGSVRIQVGDCTNAGGQDDDGVYVNGAVYSATQDDKGNVTSYNTLTGSFLPDGTSNSFTVTAVPDPGVPGALPLEDTPQTAEIDPSLALATGVMSFGIPKLCSIGISATKGKNTVGVSDSPNGMGANLNDHKVGQVSPQNEGTGHNTVPIKGVPFSANHDAKGPLQGTTSVSVGVSVKVPGVGKVGVNAYANIGTYTPSLSDPKNCPN